MTRNQFLDDHSGEEDLANSPLKITQSNLHSQPKLPNSLTGVKLSDNNTTKQTSSLMAAAIQMKRLPNASQDYKYTPSLKKVVSHTGSYEMSENMEQQLIFESKQVKPDQINVVVT